MPRFRRSRLQRLSPLFRSGPRLTMPHTLVKLSGDRDAVRLQRLLERCSDYYELHEGWSTPADAGEYELTLDPKAPETADLLFLGLEQESGRELDAAVQVLIDAP